MCYGLNVYVPPESILNNPQHDGIWRWDFWWQLGHEDGALINGISALMKRYRGEMIFLNLFLFPSLGRKIPWRREWLPTPVFLPGEFHGQRSLEGYSLWGHQELE